MIELLLWPLAAGVVLTGIHAYFGLHVLARGIIFVDLSLAQVAALGITIAILAGHGVDSAAAYWYALSFAISAAVLFSIVRRYERAVAQEVVIGIVYAVCAALAVIVLDRAPQGAEHIKQILIGSILSVGIEQLAHLAGLYIAVGIVHWLLRKPLLAASFQPAPGSQGQNRLLWDIIFYGSFAVVVTSSVRIAGVLLVFSYLIVPASIASILTRTLPARLLLAWVLGATVTAAGLGASWAWDLPTGPAIVATFGAAMAATGLAAVMRSLARRWLPTFTAWVVIVLACFMMVIPRMDQPWWDMVESVVPSMQDFFLVEEDATTRNETIETVRKAEAELTALRAMDQDVRWGTVSMPEEKKERLRQYIAARAEILAGDNLVLRELRVHARARQRWTVGPPLLLLGCLMLLLLRRRR